SERDVELTPPVEAAQTVVPRAVEIVKERRGLTPRPPACRQKLVEASPVGVEQTFVVFHRNGSLESPLQPAVEVDHVRIDVIEKRSFGCQPQGDREPAAERLHEASMRA